MYVYSNRSKIKQCTNLSYLYKQMQNPKIIKDYTNMIRYSSFVKQRNQNQQCTTTKFHSIN